ncbi:MAG: hypothetical protein KIT56_01450 [Gammaproteobacteria bacterium]|nr:hypothetical protein [Gammaproteobacteria bacterium]MCW5582550.1 hypothetical protein [Gammaproteobacteria bacterium]
MSATEVFIKGLQEATGKDPFLEKFWRSYQEKVAHTFQDVLYKYAESIMQRCIQIKMVICIVVKSQ